MNIDHLIDHALPEQLSSHAAGEICQLLRALLASLEARYPTACEHATPVDEQQLPLWDDPPF